MNVFTAVGRVGRNAEVRQTGNGTAVAGFPVAVDVGYGQNKSTLWLDAALFGKRAEGGLVQYLVKGQQVAVTGEIGTREFQKGDGSQGFAVTLRINELDLVGGQTQQAPQQSYQQPQQPQQQQQPPQGQPAPQVGGFDDYSDPIPF